MIAIFSMTEDDKHLRYRDIGEMNQLKTSSSLNPTSNLKNMKSKPKAVGVRDATIKLMKSLDSALSIKIKESSNHELPIQVLPTFTNDRFFENGRGYNILLDWPYDDHRFSHIHYKALESMLQIFPEASIRCILPTPMDAYAMKINASLSIAQFTKYKKLGYNIEASPVGRMDRGYLSQIGKEYWQRHMHQCCNRVEERLSTDLPYHLLIYIRLHKLWRKGGIFMDFSFFFLGPLDKSIVRQGYYIKSYCDDAVSTTSNSSSSQIRRLTVCRTSTIMIFNEAKSDAILCALKSYEDQTFINCIESDSLLYGANCIQDVFEACFTAASLTNDLDIKSKASVLEVFQGDPYYAKRVILSSSWHLRRNVRVFWLGALAHSFMTANLTSQHNQTMIEASIQGINLQIMRKILPSSSTIIPTISSSMMSSMAESMARFPVDRSDPRTMHCHRFRRTNSCSPSIFIPGFDIEVVASIYAILASHPMLLPPLVTSSTASGITNCFIDKYVDKYEYCYPYIEPGESFFSIDASSSYYLDRRAAVRIHEQNPSAKIIFLMENPIELIHRAYQSIALANHDEAMSLDAIILRALQPQTIYSQMRQQLQNISSIETILSLYFQSNTLDIDAASSNTSTVERSDDQLDSLARMLFQQAIFYPSIVQYHSLFGKDQVMILLADDFCRNNTSLQLNIAKIYDFLELSDHPIASIDTSLCKNHSLVTSYSPDRNQSKSMSKEVAHSLTSFFLPYYQALEDVAGLNLSDWMNPRYLQMNRGYELGSYTRQHNNTFPLLWFEMEDSNSLQKGHRQGIISHLLPKGKAAADAGFNTTFGMLVAF
jgi:hypothetical protein